MSNINVPAVATGAFLGFLALVAAVSCIPAITRFLGDLFCCPWRIPFTKKKRRNADEEVGKDELPYVVEPRADTPVDDRGYHSMSEAYMSVSLLCFSSIFFFFFKEKNYLQQQLEHFR